MDGRVIVFDDLVRCVIDGDATAEEFQDLVEMMREDPLLQRRYCLHMQVHAFLTCHMGQACPADGEPLVVTTANGFNQETRENGDRKRGLEVRLVPFSRFVLKMAACAAVLLAFLTIGYMIEKACSGSVRKSVWENTDSSVPVIRVVMQKGVRGLDLPETLPGTLRIESGEIVVRLDTGVELTLIGPANVTVHSGIRVGLDQGSLLAKVPHWATGFTVRTEELEIYDLGTVFGVQVNEGVSDVFVFKGSVQVNEAGYSGFEEERSGAGVGLCEAGEGVRAVSGETPSKIAADWPEAQNLFETVQAGRALHDPAKTMQTAMRIADLWAERYMPGSNLVAKKMRIGNGIPFQKTAWVRAPVPQQEVKNMNRASAAAVLTAAAMATGAAGAVSLEPISVNTSPIENRQWETVFTNEVNVAWRWENANAVSAELSVRGMGGEVLVTNVSRSVSNVLWRAFAETTPSAEEVYGLTLSFYDSGGAAVGVLTSRLAVVKGAFGKATVDPSPAGASWGKVRDNAVIPYDAGWTEATADAESSRLVIAKAGGAVQTNTLEEAAGYFGWKLKYSVWGYGTFNLALTFPEAEGEWNATLVRPEDGTMIRLR